MAGYRDQVILAVLLALTVIGYDYFFERPGRSMQLLGLQSQLRNREDELAIARTAKERLPRLEQELASASATIESLQARLPKRSQMGLFLDQILQVAPPRRFTFSVISPLAMVEKVETLTKDGAKAEIRFQEREIKLKINATYGMIGQYLENLEQLERLVEVTGIDLIGSDTTPLLDAQLNLKTFTLAGE